jgi:predicted TIM-barrel fold metal-dependent hydrolase
VQTNLTNQLIPMTRTLRIAFAAILFSSGVYAQEKPRTVIDFEKYNPPSTLVVPEHKLTRAKFPFIDVHNHQGNMPTQDLKFLLKQMDSLNLQVMNNLSGRGFKRVNGQFDINDHQYLVGAITNIKNTNDKRLIVFTNISFADFDLPGWTAKTVSELEKDVKAGARGLKIYKNLGFGFKDKDGNFIKIDDPKLDPVWAKCGELKIPVLIHTADPKQFWQEEGYENERWLELIITKRDRGANDPTWQELINQQHHIFQKHPKTTFIAAHFGWLANDLTHLGKVLDSFPNVNVEFGAIIAELGRQPRAAKAFFTKYQDRILFGKDSWVPAEYQTYFRVLETEDEYFPYHKKYHAYWKMYGLGLPDDILKKIYYKNAIRIIPGIDASQFPK